MKLHRNRKKRSNVKRFISLALVCCMTLTMGSSYVNAGEANPPVAEAEAAGQSLGGVEAVPLETQGAEGQEAGNMEGTPADAGQGSGEAPEKAGAGQQTPTDVTQQNQPDADAAGGTAEDGSQGVEDGAKTGGTSADGAGNEASGSETLPAEGQDPAQDQASADTNGQPAQDVGQQPSADGGQPQNPDSGSEPAQDEASADESKEQETADGAGDGQDQPPQPSEDIGQQPSEDGSQEQEPGSNEPVADGGIAVDGPNEETAEGDAEQNGADESEEDLPVYDSEEASGLDDVPADMAGAVMYRLRRGAVPNNGADIDSFAAHYVNQQDAYDVTLYQNFNLKYQMEFHASQDYEPGHVMIKVNAELFQDRNGNSVLPSEIGVPQGTLENSTTNRSTPFNYYYEGDGADKKLVFFNYKKITAGTNAAWQVLYKDQKLMDIIDGTGWTLTPQISVDKGETYQPAQQLNGQIDSSVSIDSVTKSYYTESGLNYTPGLYTLAQVKRYISGEVDKEFLNDAGRLDTANWHFAVWDVKVKGTATQPWDMVIADTPGGNGKVVGYKDNSNRATAYKLPIGAVDEKGTALTDQREESWGNRFYVVTAYPAESTPEGTEIRNDITIRLVPGDGKDAPVDLPARTATWTYLDYDWTYSGNVIGIRKETDNTVYTGWLDAYRLSKVNGADYGDMPFTTTGHMYGYSFTHRTQSGSQDGSAYTVGDYIPGTYYTLTTVDDFMYLYAEQGNQGQMMGRDDYYFSAVTVSQTDYGYDVWEDEKGESELGKMDPASLPEALKEEGAAKSKVRIYAMLAAPENAGKAEDGWTWIDTVDMDASGSMAPYSFSEEVIAQQPWRVKVEHDTIDYETVCKIDVKVRIKSGSAKMDAILEARKEAETNARSPEVKFENLSGVMGKVYGENGSIGYFTDTDGDNGSDNYSELGLEAATKALYQDDKGNGMLLVRDNAYRTVTWLNETAASFKNAKSTNDVDNNRVLVDYFLTAYDGYEIYDRGSLAYLREEDQDLISPGRSHVAFYDLLPYGMQFDASYPITAGRVTDLSSDTYQTQPKSWDGTQVTVTVDPERDIITDYRGTGRTMVVFHIAFTGADATSYTDRKWIEGWGVSFRAYYDWKDMDQLNHVDINANLSAFMPDFSELAGGSNESHPALVGLKTEVDYDDGTHGDTGADFSVIDKAYADMVKEYTDGEGNAVKGNIDGYRLFDQAGNPYDTNYRNVLYAKNVLMDDVATSSQSKIEKLVRADSDRFGTFDRAATVPMNGLYTYDINVTTATGIQDIAVFDRLEQAARDREGTNDPFAPFEENTWSGTFQALDTSGLDKRGISYTVYYSESSEAPITTGIEPPEDILKEENGWYEADRFEEAKTAGDEYTGTWQDYVKAVAVKLDSTYKLEANHSISFRIQMKAPQASELGEGSSLSTYNNASYASTSTVDGTKSTVEGNSVKVTVSAEETLEVIKETSGPVPGIRQDESFEFRLYEEYTYEGVTEKQYLAYKEYSLYKLSGNGSWEQQEGLHATDGNGYLYLHAGEKAVFEVADAERIQVKETESVFWEPETEKQINEDAESGKRICSITVTNTYRPVLYMQKKLSAVPDGVDTGEDGFVFKIEVKRNDSYFPLADAEFWYVDSARLDGGVPRKLDSGVTDGNGQFALKEGEIVALFPGAVGTEYRISEVDAGEDWVCENDTITGATVTGGSSKSITNYYRWKELLLTKDITHQTKEDYDAAPQPFTFRISEVGKDQEGKEVLTPAAGKEWALLDETGNEAPGTADGTGSQPDGAADSMSGILDEKGEFTCPMGFRTVRIKGLEAGKTYRIEELTEGIDKEDGKPLYVPADGGSATTQMPVYSTRKNVTITNDYQKRPLSVTKTVVKASGGDGSTEPSEAVYFRFCATVNGKTLPQGTPYTVTKAGSEEAVTRYVGSTEGMDAIHFADGGTEALGENEFLLADGETAVFKDVGMIGDEITVREVDNGNQIYPANKGEYEDALSDDGTEASFVNGEEGSLLIGKEYVGLDEIGRNAVEELRADDGMADWLRALPIHEESWGSVEFVLRITDSEGTYTWPEIPVTVKCINKYGEIEERTFEPGDSIKVTPWETIVIPTGEGTSIPSDAEYTLIETEEYRKRIIRHSEPGEGLMLGKRYWLQVSQSAASDALASPETVSARPSAVICNEVSSIGWERGGSMRFKAMTSGSDEIPEGKKLVWRVERYDQGSGTWLPASGIPYVTFDATEYDPEPVSKEVETTNGDGLINLYKQEGYPQVWFPEDMVYLNLYKEEDIGTFLAGLEEGKELLRLVEVPEESDAEWGMLVGYMGDGIPGGSGQGMLPQASQTGQGALSPLSRKVQMRMSTEPGGIMGIDTQYGLDMPPAIAIGFVNSNSRSAVEIEKYMKGSSDTLFTMILEQVVSTSLGENDTTITKDNYRDTIVATRPGADIPYTVYDSDGSVAGSGVTGSGGEIRLEAGQYARLEVPDGTMWTVSEKTSASPNYRLTDLQPESGDVRLTKLNENLMLIHLPEKAVPVLYGVEWYSKDGRLLKSETRNGVAGQRVSITEEDKQYGTAEGYSFDKDDGRNVAQGYLKANADTTLKLYFTQSMNYTVEWYDIEGEMIKGAETRTGTVGGVVSVTQEDKNVEGYVFHEESKGNILTTTLAPNGKNVLRLYFKKSLTCKVTVKTEYWQHDVNVAGKNRSPAIVITGVAGDVITAEMLSERMPEWSEYEINGEKLKFWLSEDNPSITLQEDVDEYSITIKYVRNLYTVLYTDGVAGEIVFPNDEHDECREGDLTPEFSDPEALERKGYTFMGWSPTVKPTVSGEDAEYFEGKKKWVIEYQATWEKN